VAVILAAGEARQMGHPLALLKHEDGKSFFESLVYTFWKGGCSILGVIGKDGEMVHEQHPGYGLFEDERWADGPLSSIQVGVTAALERDPEVVLLHPVGMPTVLAPTITLLLKHMGDSEEGLRPEFEGAPGYPLVLSRAQAEQLLDLEETQLETVMQGLKLRRIPVKDPGVVVNIDTPEAYERLWGMPPQRVEGPSAGLDEGEEYEASLAGYDETIDSFGTGTEPSLLERELVAEALFEKGSLLSAYGGDEEAVACFDELIQRFGEAAEPSLHEWVAEALIAKVSPLMADNRPEAARTCLEEVVRRYGEAPETALRLQVATALSMQGRVDELVRRYGEAPETALRLSVVAALTAKARRLREEGRMEEMLACQDELVRRFGGETELSILKEVARILFEKGELLFRKGRREEAVDSFDELVLRLGDTSEKHLLDWVARALAQKGKLLALLGRYGEARSSYNEIIRRFGASPERPLRRHAEMALSSREALRRWVEPQVL
jgi:molybdenum cofactor cytidylyltransferase